MINKNQWKIIFSIKGIKPEAVSERTIIIKLWDKDWNDFGFKTDCSIEIFKNPENNLEVSGKIAFLSMKSSSYKHVLEIFEKYSDPNKIQHNESLKDYYSILSEISHYREIVEKFGVTEASRILNSINDMALAKAKKSRSHWFKKAQQEKAFTESLIRTSEAFYSFSNSSFLLNGLEKELFDSVSSKLKLKFSLEGFTNPHELEFSFDKNSFIPKNISVIIGKNGVGKSQSLSHLVKGALNNDQAILSDPDNSRPMISRILALATPGETSNTFPTPRNTRNINYRRLSLARASRGDNSATLPDLVHQLARSNERIGKAKRWGIFMIALKSVLDPSSIAFKLTPYEGDSYKYQFEDSDYASLDDFVFGNEEKLLELRRRLILTESPRIHSNGNFHPMSSGQISFFRFVLHACLYIENGTLVLIDEPETHLHPNLISDFFILLNDLLTQTGSIAIISTHSAYFVRELPRDQVLILRTVSTENGKSISCERPRLGTFGSNVGSISHFVFEDQFSTLLSRLTKTKTPDRRTLENIKNEISLEAYLKFREKLEAQK